MSRSNRKPHVVIMEHTSSEWQILAGLLQPDIRMHIDIDKRFSRPETLLKHLRKCAPAPEVILVDAEYWDPDQPLANLLPEIAELCPESLLICFARNPQDDMLHAILSENGRTNHVHGFWHREDIGYGLAAMICKAIKWGRDTFSYTPRMEKTLRRSFSQLIANSRRMPSWQLYDELSSRLGMAAELLHLQGKSALRAADQMKIDTGTIHRYKNRIYNDHLVHAWNSDWYDQESLEPYLEQFQDLDDQRIKDAWVFHILTSLPRQYM